MSKISFQFHSMPEELPWLIEQICKDGDISAFAIPKGRAQVEAISSSRKEYAIESSNLIAFIIDSPRGQHSKISTDFMAANSNALFLEVGSLTKSGLQESWIYAMTGDADAMRRWRSIAKRLRSQMVSGISAKDPDTGAVAPLKNHRFTDGARDAALRGVRMLPVAGNSFLLPPAAANQ